MPALIAAMLLLPVLYAASYLAMLTPEPVTNLRCGTPPVPRRWERYRFQDENAQWFFALAHQIDRRIRPAFWEETKREREALLEEKRC